MLRYRSIAKCPISAGSPATSRTTPLTILHSGPGGVNCMPCWNSSLISPAITPTRMSLLAVPYCSSPSPLGSGSVSCHEPNSITRLAPTDTMRTMRTSNPTSSNAETLPSTIHRKMPHRIRLVPRARVRSQFGSAKRSRSPPMLKPTGVPHSGHRPAGERPRRLYSHLRHGRSSWTTPPAKSESAPIGGE